MWQLQIFLTGVTAGIVVISWLKASRAKKAQPVLARAGHRSAR